jgi:RNA polymerase sigma factor (sigma-70 family)
VPVSAPRLLPLARGAKFDAEQRIRCAVLAHSQCLARVLGRSGLSAADAEEVSQDAFWVLARRLADVPERAQRSFLIGTALRMASERKRKDARSNVARSCDPDALPTASRFEDSELDQRTFRALLGAALDALSDEDRSVFVLGELEEMSRQEVARILAIPEGTVATRLARANAVFEKAVRRTMREKPLADASAALPIVREQWETRDIGPHRYENNSWGADRAAGRFEQRLVTRERDGRQEAGWTWRWPGLGDIAFAFPEVVAGWKPWGGGVPTDPRFPFRIEASPRSLLHYAVETFAHGRYNLAVDLWLTNSPGWSPQQNPGAIVAEVLVLLDYSAGARPPGKREGAVTVDGQQYDVFRADGLGADYRAGSGWPCFSFQSRAPATRGTVDLGALLGHLVRLGRARPDQHVASIELGNEIMGGAGTTWIERFDLELGVLDR